MSKIECGNCLDVLKKHEDNSVDLIVTDPPYGISFMGKDWDKALPSVDIWKECLRVLKPGAFAFIMSGPRQDVLYRMMGRLEQAGFDVGFTSIYWAYASGFPKAMNMGKKVDKKLGNEREVVGRNPNSRENCDKTNTIYESGTVGKTAFITKGTSELEGSYGGFQPKPAVEIIIVVMKPLAEETYIEQALKNKKGVTWFDDCRIPIAKGDEPKGGYGEEVIGFGPFDNKGGVKWKQSPTADKGRFPANLVVSDDILNDGEDHVGFAGQTHITEFNPYGGNSLNESSTTRQGFVPGFDKSGSFSRFFSLDTWWERQFSKLPENVRKVFPFLICPKASKGEKNKGCDELEDKDMEWSDRIKSGDGKFMGTMTYSKGDPKMKNNHPTVKPLKLMSYLITLGSRSGEVVLDPFMGSGTTCVAAKMLGREYIGIEMNSDYFVIAQTRIEASESPMI